MLAPQPVANLTPLPKERNGTLPGGLQSSPILRKFTKPLQIEGSCAELKKMHSADNEDSTIDSSKAGKHAQPNVAAE